MRVEQGHAMKQCFDINCSQFVGVELGAQRSVYSCGVKCLNIDFSESVSSDHF